MHGAGRAAAHRERFHCRKVRRTRKISRARQAIKWCCSSRISAVVIRSACCMISHAGSARGQEGQLGPGSTHSDPSFHDADEGGWHGLCSLPLDSHRRRKPPRTTVRLAIRRGQSCLLGLGGEDKSTPEGALRPQSTSLLVLSEGYNANLALALGRVGIASISLC